jgi:predicted metal-dependent peptidase
VSPANAESPLEVLAAARMRVGQQAPYLNAALFRLRFLELKGAGLLVDPGWRCFYDPEQVVAWGPKFVAGLLLHHLWHLLRSHAARRGPRDSARWNLCADLEVNDGLPHEEAAYRQAQTSVALPPEAVWPGKQTDPWLAGLAGGLTAEEYYELLPPPEAPVPAPRCVGPAAGCCGGIAGNPDALERSLAVSGRPLPAPPSPVDEQLVRFRVAHAIRLEAVNRGAGLPGGAARWADVLLGPEKVSWRRALRGSIRAAFGEVAGMTEQSYSRLSRREVPGVILPALVARPPNVAIVIDTSASVDDALLGEFLREVRAILRLAGHKGAQVISCDAAAGAARLVFSVRGLRHTLRGGGGTDLGEGLAVAAALRPKPDLTVVLTDGETNWPAARPACGRVIVGVIGTNAEPGPRWARVIQIERDETTRAVQR